MTALRPRTLGGSTIGAAVGVDPYCSPIRLWLDLTQGREREENEAMRWGTMLQPLILAAVHESGVEVFDRGGEHHDRERAWLVGHPDAYAVNDDGPCGIIEAKPAGYGYHDPPLHWQTQVQTYMHLTGLDEALIAQLAGLHLTVWEVERDQHAIEVMLRLAEEFIGYVESEEQPPPQGHPDDRAALLELHPHGEPGKIKRETRAVREARRELAALLEAEKARKARIERLRAVITDHMGDADTLMTATDDVVATWRDVSSRRIDTKRLKAEQPELYEAYSAETTTRRLVLT